MSLGDGADTDFGSLVRNLETARERIETRFLEGGNAVLAILDVLNALVQSLDALTGSLDADTAEQTTADLEGTIDRLAGLIDLEASRQVSFRAILGAEQNLRPQIGQMQETLRYLRTFAVTAKITGAGIPEFGGFAEEILQRIQDGRRQVDDLSRKLDQLGGGLGPVIAKGESILEGYRSSIPEIVSGLTDGVGRISNHRRQLGAHATSVKAVAARIQTKLGSTLSAMQIGDATRQRIEHCQAAIGLMETALADAGLGKEEAAQLENAVRGLVSLQLDQSTSDFARETEKIVATVASFRSDLEEIGTLRRLMTGGGGEENGSVLRQLEMAVAGARNAVREVEAVANEAGGLTRAIAATVADLVAGIGVVQLVRTDIHYMALNTNLRCSRVGEEGKAINVVAAELRNFAAQLDETAEKILIALQTLEKTADHLQTTQADAAEKSLDARLAGALASLRDAAGKMEEGLVNLAAQSETAEEQTGVHLARLDFNAELGDVLRECAEQLSSYDGVALQAERSAALTEVGNRILGLYTMASERELHARIFGAGISQAATPSSTTSDDDDLLDALF